MSSGPFAEGAAWWWRRVRAVVPMSGKHPLVEYRRWAVVGQTYRDATALVGRYATADIAIMNGPRADGTPGVITLDADGPFGPSRLARYAADHGLPLPPTLAVRTPSGGEHRYYLSSTPIPIRALVPRSSRAAHDGVELRGCGLSVVPPSSRRTVVLHVDIAPLPGAWSHHPPYPPSSENVGGPTHRDRSTILATWGVHVYEDRDIAARAAMVLGIQAAPGRAFRCVLPGHTERRPSAAILPGERSGQYCYHDYHLREPALSRGLLVLTLPEVLASRHYGHAVRLRDPSELTWSVRLLVQAGVVAPAPVPVPRLPSAASAAVAAVWRGFTLVLACKWLVQAGAPSAYTRRFAAAWAGVTEDQARAALVWLRERGYLCIVGHHTSGVYGRTVPVYLPGAGDQRQVS